MGWSEGGGGEHRSQPVFLRTPRVTKPSQLTELSCCYYGNEQTKQQGKKKEKKIIISAYFRQSEEFQPSPMSESPFTLGSAG